MQRAASTRLQNPSDAPERAYAAASPLTSPLLTLREREVLAVVRTGKSNNDIADQLQLSAHTVKVHVRNLMKKLDVHRRMQLVTDYYAGRHSALTDDCLTSAVAREVAKIEHVLLASVDRMNEALAAAELRLVEQLDELRRQRAG